MENIIIIAIAIAILGILAVIAVIVGVLELRSNRRAEVKDLLLPDTRVPTPEEVEEAQARHEEAWRKREEYFNSPEYKAWRDLYYDVQAILHADGRRTFLGLVFKPYMENQLPTSEQLVRLYSAAIGRGITREYEMYCQNQMRERHPSANWDLTPSMQLDDFPAQKWTVIAPAEHMRGVQFRAILALRDEINVSMKELFPSSTGQINVSGLTLSPLQYGKILSGLINLGVDLPDESIMTLRDERGAKNGPKWARAFKKAGRDMDAPECQKLVAEWNQLLAPLQFDYEVDWTPQAFDLLGHIPYVDGLSSCYARGKGCENAPAILATGFMGQKATFVVLLKKDGNVVARCWGFSDGSHCYITNAYYGGGVNDTTGMRPFIAAIVAASEGKWQPSDFRHIGEKKMENGFSLNGDAVATGSHVLPNCQLEFKELQESTVKGF